MCIRDSGEQSLFSRMIVSVHHMGIVFYVFAQLYRIIEFHLFALFNALPIERWNVFYIIDLDYKLTTQFAETSTAQQ